MSGEFTGELAKSYVIAVRSGAGARAERRRVLSYQGDLHPGGLLADESQCGVVSGSEKWHLDRTLRENTVSH
jgi:hypothetical protein